MSAITPHAPAGHDATGHGHDDHHGHGHDHPPHLAHHFDTPEQQFDSAKIGMWVFLATEILMFGGLFCAYAVYRYNNPDVFRYTEHHLNTTLGATNTVVLLASSLTMALGVRAAQLGQQTYLKLMLIFTLFGGVGFMCIKAVEYYEKFSHGLVPGVYNDYSREADSTKASYVGWFSGFGAHHGDDHAEGGAADHGEGEAADHAEGEAAGHAEAAAGDHDVPSDANPSQTDLGGDAGAAHAADESHGDDHAEGASEGAAGSDPPAVAESTDTQAPAQGTDLAYMGPDYVDPHLGTADAALVRPAFAVDRPSYVSAGHTAGHGVEYDDLNVKEKSNVKAFFGIYFMMTGLHGLHVLIGMGLISWVLLKGWNGLFGPAYFTPVDLVGLYWHLVDLIWIFLFPLLYLIH